MTYSEALDWLEQVGRGGSRLGLDRVRDYLTRLGAPQDQIPMIHVAGTNGKGSVSACLSAIHSQKILPMRLCFLLQMRRVTLQVLY